MAADETSRGRVTNAELDRALADLKELVSARFDTVNVKIDAVTAVSARVEALEQTANAHSIELAALHAQVIERSEDRTFWRRNWPGLLLSALAVAVALVSLF